MAPEPDEILHFAGVALHPHHLHDDLQLGAALLLHAGETHEIVPHLFESGSLTVKLKALFRRTVEAERYLLERGIEQALRNLFVQKGTVRRDQRRNGMLRAQL